MSFAASAFAWLLSYYSIGARSTHGDFRKPSADYPAGLAGLNVYIKNIFSFDDMIEIYYLFSFEYFFLVNEDSTSQEHLSSLTS